MNTSDEIRFSLSEVPRRTTTGTAVGDIGIELAARGSEWDSFSEPYGHENEPAPPPCFKCEYDVKKELYVIREPKVIVPGQDKPIEPKDPGELKKNRTYVCAVTRENNKVKAEIVEEDKVPDEALVSVPICKIDDSRGFDIITQYHVGAIVLGGTTFVGDMDGSEVIGGAGEEVLVTGHPGAEDSSGRDSHSGIQFLTVSSREDGGETIPAKLIARIKGKDENEDWAAHKLTIKGKDGNQQILHFLGGSDFDIDLSGGGGGGGGGGGDLVVGSDYIKVEDEQDAQDAEKKNKAIKAKINTPNAVPSSDSDKHALLTNDTNQNVRSAKTFLGNGQPSSSNRIIVDGPNAKLQAKSADGNKTVEVDAAAGKETLTNGSKRIVLDPSAMPDECQKKEISVKTLKVTHRYAKDGKSSETYHILGCDDVEIFEGDIKKLKFKKTGSQDVEFDGTEDKTVEITVRNLVAGSGISLTTSGNNITITNTAQGGGGGGGGSEDGITGDVPFLDGFQYDKVNHKLQYRFGLMTFEKGILVGVKQGQIHGMNFEDVPGGDAVEETV